MTVHTTCAGTVPLVACQANRAACAQFGCSMPVGAPYPLARLWPLPRTHQGRRVLAQVNNGQRHCFNRLRLQRTTHAVLCRCRGAASWGEHRGPDACADATRKQCQPARLVQMRVQTPVLLTASKRRSQQATPCCRATRETALQLRHTAASGRYTSFSYGWRSYGLTQLTAAHCHPGARASSPFQARGTSFNTFEKGGAPRRVLRACRTGLNNGVVEPQTWSRTRSEPATRLNPPAWGLLWSPWPACQMEARVCPCRVLLRRRGALRRTEACCRSSPPSSSSRCCPLLACGSQRRCLLARWVRA